MNPNYKKCPTCGQIMLRKGRQSSKLTPEQVRIIRSCGGLLKDAARRFGVSVSLVSLIRKGDVWKHQSAPHS